MNKIYCRGYIKQRYPIYLSSSTEFEDLFDLLPYSKNCFVIIDEKLTSLYPGLISKLEQRKAHIMPVVCTEQNKSLDGLTSIFEKVFPMRPNRDDILIAIGGGLITNLGGLAASMIMRGIRFYYVPTTLTGQVDASIGSKQAINYRGAKNWLGMYNDPEFCYVNPNFLITKPMDELNFEAIEGIKLCLATNKQLFYQAIDEVGNFHLRKPETMISFIEKMIRAKVAVVENDLLEESYGMSMLYGHTLGHAIEMLDHEHISHGEAVGLGMLAAARMAHKLGLAEESLITLHVQVLRNLGLPTEIPGHLKPLEIFAKLGHNKKNYGGEIRFVLLRDVGEMAKTEGEYYTVVPENVIMQSISEGY
jgi:3-dehydroquinate synthase